MNYYFNYRRQISFYQKYFNSNLSAFIDKAMVSEQLIVIKGC